MSASSFPSAAAAVQLRWDLTIPLRDGVQLSAILYLPPHPAKAPVIFTLTPYIAQTWHDVGLHFATHGYPFLSIDVRGRGNSEGTFRPLINEAQDGFDVVEWIARQPFCNGQVAMWGGSYAGYAQWAAAKEFPPHLATIVPTAAAYVGVNFPIRGNLAMPYWMQWLTLVWGRTSQDRLFWNNKLYWGQLFRRWFESGAPFRELDSQLGAPSEIFQEWLSHPHQDAYWDSYNPTADQYAKLSIPVLTITGIYDAAQIGALHHYREHLKRKPQAAHFVVIGPWDHAGTRAPAREFCGIEVGPASLVDLPQLHLEWYAWTMQGRPRPSFLKDRVAYYVLGADRWRYASTVDAITGRWLQLFLHSSGNPDDVFRSGSLREGASSQGDPDHYVHDPANTNLAALESTVDPENKMDQRMVHASAGRQLVYHSAPFELDAEVSGSFKLTLWIAIDQPDTDFRASIYEVGLDGSALLLTSDSIRARYRESFREPRLIATTEPLRYELERFPFVSRLVRKGHRLRLVVGPVQSIYSEKNYSSGGVVADESMRDARVVTVRLFHDARHPSVLQVPLAHPEANDV
jgi:putative CocE/NonD family hydrolase